MGGYVASINNYRLYYGDYAWDYVKDKQPKEYYENYMIDGQLTTYDENNRVVDEKDIKIPLLELVDIKKNRKTYSIDWVDKKTLHRYLYKVVTEEFKEEIELYARLYIYKNDSYDDDEKYNIDYFLQSPIGDDNIMIGRKPMKWKLTNYDQFFWLKYNGFEHYYVWKNWWKYPKSEPVNLLV